MGMKESHRPPDSQQLPPPLRPTGRWGGRTQAGAPPPPAGSYSGEYCTVGRRLYPSKPAAAGSVECRTGADEGGGWSHAELGPLPCTSCALPAPATTRFSTATRRSEKASKCVETVVQVCAAAVALTGART